jgi:hypothetical protein
MWLYWFLFAVPAWRAVAYMQTAADTGKRWGDWWRLIFVLLVLAIGLRHQVGGDWNAYIAQVDMASSQTLWEAVSQGDPAYSLLNWLAAESGLGVYFVNTVSAAIFSWGLLVFCRAQPLPWLALVVAIPYLVTVVAMGYTRQGVAIGLAMLALVALTDRKLFGFVVLVALAATFHKSAVILLPLAVLAGTRQWLWTVLWAGLASAIFYALLLQDAVAGLQSGYIEAQYQSQGAAVRIAMNAVPSLLFLWLRHRFAIPQDEKNFWTWMSLAGLGFVVLLLVSSSSTAVDRLALYWIPLQIFMLSRLPNAMGGQHGYKKWWTCSVVAYSAVVLFVWLFFGAFSGAWLPYQFYPWVAFWR